MSAPSVRVSWPKPSSAAAVFHRSRLLPTLAVPRHHPRFGRESPRCRQPVGTASGTPPLPVGPVEVSLSFPSVRRGV